MSVVSYTDWSREDLINEITKLRKTRRYGLVWDDNPEIEAERCKTELPVLVEKEDKQIITDDYAPFNVIIEGDNYHALSVLNYTHKGEIDFIYIDPPYNVGKKTWKYNNKYVEEDDPYRHSKWISFMHKRLKIARSLLKENGIICAMIDNYEMHNLRHLMEDIFSDKEIIVTVIEHNYRGRAKSNFALTHEYAIWAVPKQGEAITRLTEKSEDIRRNLRRTGQGSMRTESPTMFYGIEVNKQTLEIISVTEPIPIGDPLPETNNPNTVYVFPIDTNGLERRWYYSPKTTFEEYEKGTVWAKRIKGKIEIHYWKPGKESRRKSVWTGPLFDSSTYGSELLTEIIGKTDFPYPKSIHAVKTCIEAGTNNKNATILDFFGGSGTTGHAVLSLNEEDGGKRKFILVTNNENKICEEILYPRIKNVINGYEFKGKDKKILFEKKITASTLKDLPEYVEDLNQIKEERSGEFDSFETKVEDNTITFYGIKQIDEKKDGLGGNVKYFATDFVSGETTDMNKVHLVQRSTAMLCLKESCFSEEVSGNFFKIFSNKRDKLMGIIFDDFGIGPIKEEIKKVNKKISLYIFSLDEGTKDDEFTDISELVEIKPIPASILNTYRRIFK